MIYRVIPPPADLAGIVRIYWTLEDRASAGNITSHRLFADPFPGLVFHYDNYFTSSTAEGDGEAFPPLILHGPSRRYQDMEVRGAFGIVGAYLYPFSLRPLFGLPAHEVSERFVDLHAILGAAAGQLAAQLQDAGNTTGRLRVFSDFLRHRIRAGAPPDAAVQYCVQQLQRAGPERRVEQLASQLGISTRQLERKFQAEVGFNPKLFGRLLRFQSSLGYAELSSVHTLTELAHRCGYADQSHFTREFKDFAGLRPRQYFKGALASADNFVRMPEE